MAVTKSPVYEVGFAVQHSGDVSMTVLDVADLHAQFRDQYPLFQQADLAGPMDIPVPGPVAPLPVVTSSIPRLWFISADSRRLVQIQHNRIGYNWRRLAPASIPAEYPGYEALKQSFIANYRVAADWIRQRAFGSPEPDVAELFYTNTVPVIVDGAQRRISDMLSFYKPGRAARIFGFNTSWIEPLDNSAFPGALTVTVNSGQSVEGEHTMNVYFVARFSVEGADEAELLRRFDIAHGQIHSMLPHVFSESILESFK